MLPYRIFRTARLLHYSTRLSVVMVLFLGMLTACTTITPTPVVIPPAVLTPPVIITPTLSQATPSSNSTIEATSTPLAVAAPAPERLIEPDTSRPLVNFGPRGPSGQWLLSIRRFDQPLFVVHSLIGATNKVTTFGLGTPLGWSNDGSLIIWRPNDQPQTLLALEPTTGVTLTVATTKRGTIDGFTWLRETALYSIQGADVLELAKITEKSTDEIVARLPERRLLSAGLIGAPDGIKAALLVTSTTTLTSELYLFDPALGALQRIDSAQGQPDAHAIWATDGMIYYDLGAGLRRYDPTLDMITQVDVEAIPLAWTPLGLLAQRRSDHALFRWRTDGSIEPFNTGEQPVIVDAAQFYGGNQVLFLINGEVWRSDLP